MIVTAHRMRSIGWFALLAVCAGLVMVLAFRVNALRSEVHRAEQRIVALRQEKLYLETEFETRANQQQLKAWNDVEFGYVAPGAGQYLENERQLASFAKPEEPGAPEPIRVASVDDSVVAAAAFPAMVSPLTGRPAAEAETGPGKADAATPSSAPARLDPADLGERLATVGTGEGKKAKAGPGGAKAAAGGTAPREEAADRSANKATGKAAGKVDKAVDKVGRKSSATAKASPKPATGKANTAASARKDAKSRP